jgi:hypothetical protein
MPEIAWGKKVSTAFKSKVISISENLGCDPSHLMAAMAFETGETFSPSIKNKQSGATGLIQFMPKTAKGLGTTTSELAEMTVVDQLDFVAKYLKPFKNKMQTVSDVYICSPKRWANRRLSSCSPAPLKRSNKTKVSMPTRTVRSPKAKHRPKFKPSS